MLPDPEGPAIVWPSIPTTPWASPKECHHWYYQGHSSCPLLCPSFAIATWGVLDYTLVQPFLVPCI